MDEFFKNPDQFKNGPIDDESRKCRDCVCCIIFIVILLLCIVVAIFGFWKGKPSQLFYFYDDDGNALATNRGAVTVNIVAQKELNPPENQTNNYSDNANLKSLEVVGFALTPEFDPGTTTYSLEVENEVNN